MNLSYVFRLESEQPLQYSVSAYVSLLLSQYCQIFLSVPVVLKACSCSHSCLHHESTE